MSNQDQYQKTVITMLLAELHKWERGEVKWTVSNQFNEEVLKSALQELKKPEVLQDTMKFFRHTEPTVMVLAHHISKFNTPELESAWVD